jgi:large subunit ribosomal protein L17
MSSHRRRVKTFSRKSGPRKALLRGLMINLVEHGRITTTVEKAKELRRHIEKAVTMGKKGDLNSRRILISRIANPGTVSAIISDISPRFQTRPGGYTRIIKIGRRPGDTAEMAFIEFVDYDYTTAGAAKTVAAEGDATGKKKTKSTDKAAAKSALALKSAIAKKTSRLLAAKRKSVKTIQKKSRQASRA